MQVHEEVYTSAARLLEEGASGLGIVARSRSFPQELEADLKLLRSYTLLQSLPIDDPSRHPVRLTLSIRGRQNRYYCLTRTVYAGADHTGRTTPLSHQVICNVDEMRRSHVTPSAALEACLPLFYDRWQREPRWIDPPRNIAVALEDRRPETKSVWQTMCDARHLPLLWACIAERLILHRVQKRQVLLCIPVELGREIGDLIVNLLDLLPDSVQWQVQCVSHSVDPTDSIQDAALVVTYPDSALRKVFAARQDPRAPVIFDLTKMSQMSLQPITTYGRILSEILQSLDTADLLRDSKQLFDDVGAKSDDLEIFGSAWHLRRGLERAESVQEIQRLAVDAATLAARSNTCSRLVEKWGLRLVSRLAKTASATRDANFVNLAIDTRWPNAVCVAAAKAARDEVEAALSVAVRGTDQQAIEVASRLIAAAYPTFETILSWIDCILEAPDEVQRRLLQPIVMKLTSVKPLDINPLYAKSRTNDVYCKQVFLPLLERLLERQSSNSENWAQLASRLVDSALCAGSEDSALRWLATHQADRISETILHDWHARATRRGHEARFAAALRAAGITAPCDLIVEQPRTHLSPEPLEFPRSESFARQFSRGRPRRSRLNLLSAAASASIGAFLSLPLVLKHFEVPAKDLGRFASFAHAIVVLGIVSVAVWVVTEVSLRLITIAPRFLRWTKGLKGVILAVLCLAMLLTGWRLYVMHLDSKVREAFDRMGRQSASTISGAPRSTTELEDPLLRQRPAVKRQGET